MKTILRSFFYRTFKTKGFWIQFAVMGLIGVICGVIGYVVVNYAYQEYLNAIGTDYEYTYMMVGETINRAAVGLIAINGGVLVGSNSVPHPILCVICILICIRFHNEMSSGSMRNYIVSGYSRKQAYRSLFVGFLVYGALLYASFAISMLLPTFLLPGGFYGLKDLSAVGQYLAIAGLSIVIFLAYYAFSFFLNVLLNGNAFAGPLAILIYLVLALISMTPSLIQLLFLNPLGGATEEEMNRFREIVGNILVFTPYGQTAIVASGNLAFVPGDLIGSILGGGGSSSTDETALILKNVLAIVLENGAIGVGSFFLGQHILAKRDLR